MKRMILILLSLPMFAQFNFTLDVQDPIGSPAVAVGDSVLVRLRTQWSGFCLGIGQLYVSNPSWSVNNNSGSMSFLGGSNPCSAGFFEWTATIPLQPGTNYINFTSCIQRVEDDRVITCSSTVLTVTTCEGNSSCDPPAAFSISSITTNSFQVSTQVGCQGGSLSVKAANFSKTFPLLEGAQTVQVNSLLANTQYEVCQVETCGSGTSQATCQTVSTASNDTSNGLLTPPAFVGETSLSLNEQNQLQIQFVDPNSDGWDRFGTSSLGYFIRIFQGCDTLFEDTYSSNAYPSTYTLPFSLPNEGYNVEISRGVLGKNGERSEGTLLVGPVPGSVPSSVPTQFLSLERWLLHIPKVSGGFEGQVLFENSFPDLPATVYLVGFDATGNRVGEVAQALVVGQSAKALVYPRNGAKGIFEDEEIMDQVSHIGVWEPGGKRQVKMFVQYRSATTSDPLPALVEEQVLGSGFHVGTNFSVQARNSEAYWDGVALLNLRSSDPVEIEAVHRKINGDQELARVNLGMVEPGKKLLNVLTSTFPYQADTYYTLEAKNGTFEVVGLRGNLVSTLMVQSQVTKKQ